MFTENQINTMVRMQDEMNSLVHPQWRDQGFPHLRSARMEAVEAMEHYGWKYWKDLPEPDIDQVKLEVVDIWHFILSFRMNETNESIYEYVDLFEPDVSNVFYAMDIGDMTKNVVSRLDFFIEETYHNDFYFAYLSFRAVMKSLEMTGDELFKLYIGKNVLNKFRQDHGYKEGTYIKNWQGKEDNEHLTEIMKKIDLDDPDIELVLRREIASRYEKFSI